MKILFLDVDGILNCSFTKEQIDGCLFVMDSKIELLKEIVDRTGVKIVLSSTWRQGWFDLEHGINSRDVKHFIALRDKLAEYGLEFLSRTPIHTMDERGIEIEEWLENWKGELIESFCILDDMNGYYIRPHANRLIRTSFTKGLLPKHVELAVKMLHKPVKMKVQYDEETTKWFQRHPDEAITILRCERCGLFYNPGIGHKCEVLKKF